ncbi:MAG: ubiquinone biosynthesis regulatory protein kinase UbiB [Thiohalomonadales bacterium]
MGGFAQLLRLIYINRILLRHGLDEVILATHLLRPLRFMAYLSPWRWTRKRHVSRAVRLRRTLEDLGPIFIKFGQILSTRRDLLPDDIANELAKLQDQVPPFDGKIAVEIIEKAFGRSVNEVFVNFQTTPLASASIAQVHTAELPDGTEVVVKVLRPGIKKTIGRDVALLHTLAQLAQRYWKDGRRLRPIEVVAEYEKTIYDELDLMREAASASQLRRNFRDSEMLYVPEVYWELNTTDVMVMERIRGTPVSDIPTLRHHNIDLRQLAENGVEIFFTQVFRDSFFHADMHPGNIFVSDKGKYIAVDFGIMGTLGRDDQHYLAENFLAFFHRDYRRVAVLHVESGWVPPDTRVDEFEAAIRTVSEPIFERPLKDISFGHLLLRLFQTARRFNMEVQPQLVLLQKTLLNIEGLGRQLYPELDLWQTAKPFLERWMHGQVGFPAFVKSMKENAPQWAEVLPEIPVLIHAALKSHQKENPDAQIIQRQAEQLRLEIRVANRRTFWAIIGSALMLSAAIIFSLMGTSANTMAGVPPLAWMLGGAGAIIILFSWPWRSD